MRLFCTGADSCICFPKYLMALTRDLQQRYVWSHPLAPSAGMTLRKNAGKAQTSADVHVLCSTTVSLHAAGYNWSSAQIKSHNHAHSRTQRLKHTHARMFGKIVHITNTLLRIKCAFFTPFFCLFKQLKSQHANETKFTV